MTKLKYLIAALIILWGSVLYAASDSFTGTDGTALATHDANWTDNWTGMTSAKIYSNKLAVDGYGSVSGYYNASSSDTSIAVLIAGSTISNAVGVFARSSAGSTKKGYLCQLNTLSGGNWTVMELDKNGTDVSNAFSLSYAASSSHTLKITASGTSPVVVNCYVDGTLVGTYTDSSSPIASGHPGIYAHNGSNGARASVFSSWTDTDVVNYTVTPSAGANGSVSPSTGTSVVSGNTLAITATPSTGYSNHSTVGGTCAAGSWASNVYTTGAVTADCTATFTFDAINYTLTYSAGANGSISGSTPQTVAYGSSGSAVTAVPSTGYHFTKWSDNSTTNPRTDSSVSGNVTVSASFAANTTVYVDPTCGSSGDGTTTTCGANGPFKTWAEVTWYAGNTYSQKGGTTANETITVGSSGTSGNIVTLNSYGTGQAIVDGFVTINSASWSGPDGNGVYSQAALSNHSFVEDGVPLLYGTSTTLAAGRVYWGSGNNYYRPSSGNPASHTLQYTRLYGVNIGAYSYITVNNIKFKNSVTGIGNATGGNVSSGVYNNYISITNCTFDNNDWGINILNNAHNSTNFTATGNSFSYSGNAIELGASSSIWDTVTIANNTLTYCSQKKGSSNPWRKSDGSIQYTYYLYDSEGIGTQNINNASIYNNSITGMCRGVVYFVFSSSTSSNNNIYNNYINVDQIPMQLAPESGALSANNYLYYNLLIGGQMDATYSGGYTTGLLIRRGSDTGVNYVYNNTIYSSGYIGLLSSSEIHNYVIKNNIIYGSNLTLLVWIIYLESVGANVTIDYNLYYPASNNGSGDNQWGLNGASVPWATWKGTFDTHSPSPSDPKFVSAGTDFHLTSASPAKGAGVAISGLTLDYAGKTVKSPPSMGAYEFFGGNTLLRRFLAQQAGDPLPISGTFFTLLPSSSDRVLLPSSTDRMLVVY